MAPLEQLASERTLFFQEKLVLLERKLVEIVADPLMALQDFAHGRI